MMKKSTFGAELAFFFAAAGAPDRRCPSTSITARRSLDEYERLLSAMTVTITTMMTISGRHRLRKDPRPACSRRR